MQPSLTLIYLCLNEQQALPRTLDEALDFCRNSLKDWEIIVVDDGSTDQSAAIVQKYAQEEPRVRLCQHPRNLGMGAGLRTGITASRKDYFCMLAADGQIPAAELAKMLPHLSPEMGSPPQPASDASPSIVLTTYSNRPNNAVRTLISRGFRLYMRALVGVDFALEGTYLFPTAVARDEIGLNTLVSNTFFFSFELLIRAKRLGHRTVNCQIASLPRQDGGGSRVANLKQIKRVAAEVLKLHHQLDRERL